MEKSYDPIAPRQTVHRCPAVRRFWVRVPALCFCVQDGFSPGTPASSRSLKTRLSSYLVWAGLGTHPERTPPLAQEPLEISTRPLGP